MSSEDRHAANLANLPSELLLSIFSQLPSAQAASRLSRSSRRLHDLARHEGWKAFVRRQFPSLQVPSGLRNYSEAAHALTTSSRNWDRKAFIARYIEPAGSITDGATGAQIRQWRAPTGQTMGYRPSIDSYEEFTGTSGSAGTMDWSSRRQVLTWSAGAELLIRVQEIGAAANHSKFNSKVETLNLHCDEYQTWTHWFTWRHHGSREGSDDITSVNLLKPIHKPNVKSKGECIVVGTASGQLDLVSNIQQPGRFASIATFSTNGRPVRSTDIKDSNTSSLLVAGLADSALTLYPLVASPQSHNINPISESTPVKGRPKDCRIWSTNFVSDNKVAVGLGPSAFPLHVFEVTPSGLTKTAVRTFELNVHGEGQAQENRVDTQTKKKSSSIYPISPLPAGSQASNVPGEVFLTGCYDGVIRLHDMRSPMAHVGRYWDPVDDSPIFSLQTIGRERLVAGASRHNMIKVFDLRVAGGRTYHYVDAQQGTSTEQLKERKSREDGWNVFITPHNRHPPHPRLRHRNASPVYSLSSPSSVSPIIFAGLENSVVQFDFVSILDRHPDSIYSHAIRRMPKTGDIEVKRTWNPIGNVLNLSMYNQGAHEMKLRTQRGVGKYSVGNVGRGTPHEIDERWAEASAVDLYRPRENSIF